MIMVTTVTAVAAGFVNPCDSFMEYAQAISNNPARASTTQGMTISP